MTNQQKLWQMAKAIPRGLERKDAPVADQPNPLQVLADRVLENVKAHREAIEKQIAEIREKGVSTSAHELLVKRLEGLELELRHPEQSLPPVLKSVGEQFIECDQLKNFLARGWSRGGAAMKLKEAPLFPEYKTTITSAAVGSSTPGILVPQRVPGIIPKTERRLTIRDLMPSFPTSNNAVEYVQENAFTNAASPVVENTAKAESALTFQITTDNVRTIAHWIPATRNVLDDMPGLAAFIDRKLLYGLKLKEETEILSGDNLGEHLNGLTTRATAYAGTYNVSGDTKLDKLRHAILEAEDGDDIVTGVVLNPRDWHDMQLLKTEEGGANKGSYLIGDPQGRMIEVPTIWGLPMVQTNSLAQGKFLVGAFATQAAIYDRMQAVIDISTEHDDFFVKNLVAIRAEERLTLAVFKTSAFIFGTF